jgi:hypothetical protein
MDKRSFIRFVLAATLISLNACVVVPKKVASYDQKCKVAVQRITLDIEDLGDNRSWSCTNDYCAWDISAEIAQAAFTTATSAIVSGSIAVAGNTAYWLESEGKCPGNKSIDNKTDNQKPVEQSTKHNTEYVIEEEIITKKL